jgi:hypothetical protein
MKVLRSFQVIGVVCVFALNFACSSDVSEDSGVNDSGVSCTNNSQCLGSNEFCINSECINVQQTYIKASNSDAHDWFGESVALDGDTLIIGAEWESSCTTGINGDQNNNNCLGAGAVYVFKRSGNTWAQEAYIKASNSDAGDFFGRSVALDGDTLIISAEWESSCATGINGDQNSNDCQRAGAVYVFKRNENTWSQEAYIKASNSDVNDLFGISVALDGDTLVVGAPGEDSCATGINGDQDNNDCFYAGAVYVYDFSEL